MMRTTKRVQALMIGVTLAIGGTLLAAPPTTKPAMKPTTKPTTRPVAAKPVAPALSARDSVLVESKSAGATFRVPKTWEALKTSVSGGEPDSFFAYDATGKASWKGTPPVATLLVSMQKPCTAGETLEQLVEGMRTAERQHTADVKFTIDEPFDFAGRPGWRLAWASTESFTVTDTGPKATTQRKEVVPVTQQSTLCIINGRLLQVDAKADAKRWAAMERDSGLVRSSFVWSEAAAK